MNRRGTIGIIVSVMLIIALVLVFTDPWSTLHRDSRKLLLNHPAEVDRIFLSDGYDTTLLVRQDSDWLLSGRERVNPVAVENLLFAAERIRISSILTGEPDAEGKSVRRIRFYSGNEVVLEYDFITDGTRYLVSPPGSERSYYVSLPGYPGLDLDRVFSSGPNHYREHLLIDLLPSEISLIEVEAGDGEPFRFTQDPRGDIRCLLPESDSVIPFSRLDTLAVRLLFSYFTNIRYERATGIPVSRLTGTGPGTTPLARLRVESRRGEKHILRIYPLYRDQGGEPDMFRALVAYNDRPEALVVNYIYLDVLMRDLPRYFANGE